MNDMQIAFVMKDLAHRAGRMILSAYGKAEDSVSAKGNANFVTEYDVTIQEHLIRRLKQDLPHAVFIAEEQENESDLLMEECCFIIDPIDGTTNFIHDYKQSSVSIAMVSRGVVKIGVIYDPYRNEMYHAIRGQGAYLNDKPIHVSKRPLELAVVSFGTSPYYKDTLCDKTFALAKDLFKAASDIRRTGSAAIDFTQVAAGRVDTFFEWKLSPWDFAAGLLLVAEAGGKVTCLDGSETDLSRPCSILATNGVNHDAALAIAKSYCD